MEVVYANAFLEVAVSHAQRIVCCRRTADPYTSAEDAIRAFEGARDAIAGIDRTRYGLIVDLREALGRNDAAFESEVVPRLRAMLAGFRARATIVRTVTGKLQIQRIDREQGRPASAVFLSEQEAIAYLRQPQG
jgi:hypothetical protein